MRLGCVATPPPIHYLPGSSSIVLGALVIASDETYCDALVPVVWAIAIADMHYRVAYGIATKHYY